MRVFGVTFVGSLLEQQLYHTILIFMLFRFDSEAHKKMDSEVMVGLRYMILITYIIFYPQPVVDERSARLSLLLIPLLF